jgi:YggT family protein
MSYLANAAVFLIQTFFELFVGVFLIRAALIAVNASFYDPVCQFVYKLTNPVLTPLRRFVPRWGRIELASLLVALLLMLAEIALIALLLGGRVRPLAWLLLAFVGVLNIAIWIAFWALLVRAILSFVADRYHAGAQILTQLTEPLVRPFRRLVPPIGGMDVSFLFASLALILARLLILAPLGDLAATL